MAVDEVGGRRRIGCGTAGQGGSAVGRSRDFFNDSMAGLSGRKFFGADIVGRVDSFIRERACYRAIAEYIARLPAPGASTASDS
jgi:hypothetical protein